MNNPALDKLSSALAVEEESARNLKNTRAGKRLSRDRNALDEIVRQIRDSNNLALILATERAFI